jgi:hypothetical protein
LSLRCAVVSSDAFKSQFNAFEETKAWLFADTFEQALDLLK